jgi:hypothetical protein
LNFLDFDYSEDPQGGGTFDAMASVRPEQVTAVRAEIAQVLDWAHAAFPGQQAPLDEGGEWDVDLQEASEGDTAAPWQTLTLVISGSPQFCAAFRQRFGAD